MRYDEELNILHLTAEEISQAAFSRRHGGRLAAFPTCTPAEGAPITAPMTVFTVPTTVTATPSHAEGETLTLGFDLNGEEEESALLYCRGVSYLTGALYAREEGYSALTLRILWENGERTERVTAAVLEVVHTGRIWWTKG